MTMPARHLPDDPSAPLPAAPVTAAPAEAERSARAALSRVTEPGTVRTAELIDRLGVLGALERTQSARAVLGLEPADGERELAHGRMIGARFVCPGDAEWPTQLDDLGAARPLGLWVRGAASLRLLALRSVAVVGARACTEYGHRVALELSAGLVERGWPVVSGGAQGIDAAAHRGALAVDGLTVAVLACGVDQVYPRVHAVLLNRVRERGLLVSELPLGAHPNRPRFLTRNRLIAALTRGTVVVEAARRSGSLNTARWARDLNRQVLAVPGPVTSGLSSGAHALLRSGATLVSDAPEVIESVGSIGDDLAVEQPGPVFPRDVLGPQARTVLEALPLNRPGTALDGLVRRLARPAEELLRCLYELSALGMVEREGAHWRLNPDRIAAS